MIPKPDAVAVLIDRLIEASHSRGFWTAERFTQAHIDYAAKQVVEVKAYLLRAIAKPSALVASGSASDVRAAVMRDLSRGLQVNVAAVVKNATMLQSGEVEMTFREEHQNAAGEKITVPGLFMVSVPAFIDGAPVRIPARLRYRVREGKVMWHYLLYKWEHWLRLQISDDLDKAAARTGLPSFEGTPEK